MRRTRLWVLSATVMVDMIGFGIVVPLLPFYAESMGATPLMVTLLIASFSAVQLVAAPVWGRVSDRHGRKPILVGGLVVSAGAYIVFGLADSLVVLFASRVLSGAAGGTVGVAQAYVADTTKADERARGLGMIGAAAGLGFMLGPAIGGFFSRYGLGMPAFVAAGLCTVNAVATLFVLSESRTRKDVAPEAGQVATLGGWLRALVTWPLSLLLGVYFLAISSFAAMTSVLALFGGHAMGMDAEAMGYVFTVSGATTFVVRGVLLGPLVDRLGEPRTALFGACSLAVSMLIVPLIPSPWWFGLVALLLATGAGTLFPSLASLVSRATHADVQGSILGGSQMIGGFGRVVGPLWAGWVFQRVGIGSPFLIGGVIVAAAAILSLRIPRAGFADRSE